MSTGQLLREELLVPASAAGQLVRLELVTPDNTSALLLRLELATLPFTDVVLPVGWVVPALDIVTIDALWSGAPPTAWTWSQAGGEPVTLQPGGSQCTFVAPATLDGTTLTITARTFNGYTISPLASIVITVLPNLEWTRIGGQWVPSHEEDVIA